MAKTSELIDSLERALIRFRESLTFPENDAMRDSLIHRFEYTFELSWKVMSSVLADEGEPQAGVRTIVRASARLGLIDNPEEWLGFAEARNETSHVYRDVVANRVAAVARTGFAGAVEDLLARARGKQT